MAITVSNLLEEALLLSDDSRLDLAERLIASTHTPAELLSEQVRIAATRMRALAAGLSVEVSGAEAHETVRQALRQRP
jgi:hypothetical protein